MHPRMHKNTGEPDARRRRCPLGTLILLPIAAMHCRVCSRITLAQYASGTRLISRARRTASARLRAPNLANSLRM